MVPSFKMEEKDSSPKAMWKRLNLVSSLTYRIFREFHCHLFFIAVKATALYAYSGESPEELPFEEGDELSILDRTEADWWKAEKSGVVFIVPAAYLEIAEG